MRQQSQPVRANARNATFERALDAGAAPAPDQPTSLFARRSLLGDRAAFLSEFLRHPTQIASVVPSSAFLERRLVRATDAAHARTVVELGPGTGGTTRAFLRAMRADARLLAIDLSPAFCARLAATVHDPRLSIQCGSAERIGEFLAARKMPQADAIFSGIPFSTMPPELCDRIARAVAAALAPGGRFVAYQFSRAVERYAAPYLGEAERGVELLNVPPLRLFTWIKAG